MTINIGRSYIRYTSDGVTTTFSYDFPVYDESHMDVYYDDDIQPRENWTITGIGNADGGEVTIINDLAPDGEVISLVRTVPLDQLVDYRPYDAFPAETHEGALDKLTMIAQQQQEQLDRAIKITPGEGLPPLLDFPDYDPGKGLMWDENEQRLTNSDDPLNGIVSAAQDARDEAVTAKDQALGFRNEAQSARDDAQTAEAAAEASALNAFNSAQNAISASGEAQDSRDQAFLWSSEEEDTPVDDGTNQGFSAYHWAQKAQNDGLTDIAVDTGSETMLTARNDGNIGYLGTITNVANGLVELDGAGIIPPELLPFSGLNLLGPFRGDNDCPKGPNDASCSFPDYRNPSQRFIGRTFTSGDYFAISSEGVINLRDPDSPDDNVWIDIPVEAGDGIVYAEDVPPDVVGGWFKIGGMITGGGLASDIIFNDSNTTIKGTTVQTWNENADTEIANKLDKTAGGTVVGAVTVQDALTGNTVSDSVGDLRTDIGINSDAISANTTAIGANTTAIGANTDAITALDGRVTVNEGDISDNSDAITALDSRVTVNEGGISDNSDAITALTGRVDTNETDITALTGRVTTNEDDITALDGRVTVNEGAITALDGRVTQNETDIAANTTAIQGLDAQFDDYLPLAGGTVTGTISSPDPTADAHLANKKYIDDAIGSINPGGGGTVISQRLFFNGTNSGSISSATLLSGEGFSCSFSTTADSTGSTQPIVNATGIFTAYVTDNLLRMTIGGTDLPTGVQVNDGEVYWFVVFQEFDGTVHVWVNASEVINQNISINIVDVPIQIATDGTNFFTGYVYQFGSRSVWGPSLTWRLDSGSTDFEICAEQPDNASYNLVYSNVTEDDWEESSFSPFVEKKPVSNFPAQTINSSLNLIDTSNWVTALTIGSKDAGNGWIGLYGPYGNGGINFYNAQGGGLTSQIYGWNNELGLFAGYGNGSVRTISLDLRADGIGSIMINSNTANLNSPMVDCGTIIGDGGAYAVTKRGSGTNLRLLTAKTAPAGLNQDWADRVRLTYNYTDFDGNQTKLNVELNGTVMSEFTSTGLFSRVSEFGNMNRVVTSEVGFDSEVRTIISLTQAQYDALPSKDNYTLYLITG